MTQDFFEWIFLIPVVKPGEKNITVVMVACRVIANK